MEDSRCMYVFGMYVHACLYMEDMYMHVCIWNMYARARAHTHTHTVSRQIGQNPRGTGYGPYGSSQKNALRLARSRSLPLVAVYSTQSCQQGLKPSPPFFLRFKRMHSASLW